MIRIALVALCGLTSPALEFFGNASSGTWAIIAIGRGTACLIASGWSARAEAIAAE